VHTGFDFGLQREVLALCELLFEPPRDDVPKLKLILTAEPPVEKRSLPDNAENEDVKRIKLVLPPKEKKEPKEIEAPVYVDPELLRKGRTIIDRLRNHPLSSPFLDPVDHAIYPNYRAVVSYPMDLATASKKLETGRYGALKDLIADINRIFQNCYIYNLDDSPIYGTCKKFESYFEGTVLPEAMSVIAPTATAAFSETEWKRCKQILHKLKSNPFYDFFAWPVDPERDGAPDYFDVISHPMDFGTIEKRLVSGYYKDVADFENDVELVFTNCLVYNSNPLVRFFR
jgi:hypothetical protein